MNSIDLPCRLLCASAASYYITTSNENGQYNPCGDHNPQYNSIGFVENPYIVTSLNIEAALVGKTATEIIVAFRGTLPPSPLTFDSFFDWIQDLMAKPVSNLNLPGMVHEGFLFALTTLADDIKEAIKLLDPTFSLPLYFQVIVKGAELLQLPQYILRMLSVYMQHKPSLLQGLNLVMQIFAMRIIHTLQMIYDMRTI